MGNLCEKKTVKVRERADIYHGETYGEWVDLPDGYYVSEGSIYEIAYDEREIELRYFNCPICRQEVSSEYLDGVFQDDKALFLAVMVMHYRHDHISYWNKMWGNNGHRYRGQWCEDYDTEKRKTNEKCKRQIIRKMKNYLVQHGIKSNHFLELQHTERKTLELAKKILDSPAIIENTFSRKKNNRKAIK